jgi:hypothetical protein
MCNSDIEILDREMCLFETNTSVDIYKEHRQAEMETKEILIK